MMKRTCLLSVLFFAAMAGQRAWSLGDPMLGDPIRISYAPQPGSFPLVAGGHAATIYVDPADWPGVARAATSFAGDVRSVTGQLPATVHGLPSQGPVMVIAGTLGRSALIDRLVAEHKLDADAIRGHWESSVTQVVENPFTGVAQALVLAGADKRGTIFALYTLSEQMGVSPWSWWADVRIPHHDALFVPAARLVAGEPGVKYRGIFLNDEAPALSGWTQEKFGGMNHRFYEHVFELLLRLRANYLWPAMWNNAFNEDDPADPVLADEYGIVMGTSHHEPMLRAQQEWKRHGAGPWDYTANAPVLEDFWAKGIERNRELESTVTIGMRGDGDMAMSPTANTSLLEQIVARQRQIIAAKADPARPNPQVWALYKEVQEYYEQGMRVPDDVTLLWCDDNWGNIRRLPTAEERKRPGGAGIYYHFDYVGDPRSYRWLLTYNITKIWEQMNLAKEYGADRLWVVNVGDLKPMEFPIEFFMTMARDPGKFNANNLQDYTREWAAREFGAEYAVEIASLMDGYTRFNARRKPEQLEPTTYELTLDSAQGSEADRMEAGWQDLVKRAEAVKAGLPEDRRASFFELILYPLKASATVSEMYLAAGRNRLYAKQGRASAKFWGDEVRRLFAQDATLANEYNHVLLAGKWNHMMDQTHIGYTTWEQPKTNILPAVDEAAPDPAGGLRVLPEGAMNSPASVLRFDSDNRQVRTVVLAPAGTQPGKYSIAASKPWIQLSSSQGVVKEDTAVQVSIDWDKAPAGVATASVVVSGASGGPARIRVQTQRVPHPAQGYVENDGVVSIEAEHASANRAGANVRWQLLPGFGETLSAMEAFPVDAASTPQAGKQACLDYEFTLLTGGNRALQAVLAPTLPFAPGRGLRYAFSVDRGPQTTVNAWEDFSDNAWKKAVSDGVNKPSAPLGSLSAGTHTLHFCRVDAGVVLERLYVFSGAAPREYLGPLESRRVAPGSRLELIR